MNRKALIVTAVVIAAAIALAIACDRPPAVEREEQPATVDHEATRVPGALHGIVRATDASPVANVMVVATSTDEPPVAVPELAVVTDNDGKYEWPLKPGKYRLSVTDGTHGNGAVDVTLQAGEQADVDIVVQK